MRDVEPPGEQVDERRLHRLRRRRHREVADQRDADRAGVEAHRVGADHVPVDPARRGPRRRCRSGRPGSCSRCRSSRFPSRGRPRSRARSPPPAQACTRSCRPCGGRPRAGGSARTAASRERSSRRRCQPARGTIDGSPACASRRDARVVDTRPELVGAQPPDSAASAELQRVGAPVQSRFPSCQPAGAAVGSRRPASAATQRSSAAVQTMRAVEDGARALPVQTEHVEAHRRRQRCERAGAERDILRAHRDVTRARERR